uniref:RHS repeat domain-containing protein n=1 Tax=Tenacibaculum aiptasiae TaxID=426481 RepID=UPI00232DF7F2
LASITSKLNDLGYQYKYDHRNRLVEKRIPGKDWEYIVYNKLDMPVLTQDANQRTEIPNEWLLTKYDAIGRVAYTGIYNENATRVPLQNALYSNSFSQYETMTTVSQNITGVDVYYTNGVLPIVNITIYTINYYDSYVDLPAGLTSTVTTSYGKTSTANTKGLATVNKVRVLGTNNWITTVTYYDEKARPIYVYSKNDELQTTDIVESKLDDFTGRVLETKTTHKKTGHADVVTVDSFEYDHLDRLISQTQKINNQVSNRIVKNNYDELGQLTSKVVGNGVVKGYKDVTSGISISGDVITKTGSIGWNTGLATQGSFTGDGYVEFIAKEGNYATMVGLSNSNANADFTSIKYAIHPWANNIRIYEQGVNLGNKTTFVTNDVLRIERIGNKIHYKKNGETFYISNENSVGTLLGDVSLYTNGAQIKDLKIVDNNKGLQTVDYKYNVRGWLKNINQDANNDNDLFNFSLKYNDITDANKRLYNGNISQTSWNTLNTDTSSKTYTYNYDALNRILGATGVNGSNYNVSGITYDKNGNILSLIRNGHTNVGATSFGVMDNLVYSYDNGNKLTKVLDNGNDIYGFKDGANTTTEYTYDVNGNMKTDANKGITNIVYNHLNLPTQVSIGGQNITYTYDAAGMKLKKVVNGTTTEYAGNYMYENNVLQFFNHPEGYVSPVNANDISQGFKYVYQYKDHLGNVRLSYTDNDNSGVIDASTEIIEESNYYPFGLKHKGYNGNVSSLGNGVAQKFGYNGKELEESLGLDLYEMDLRMYDPAIGRWNGIDPVTHHSMSTYTAFDNNPIFWADPSGADAENENFSSTEEWMKAHGISQDDLITVYKTTASSEGNTNGGGNTSQKKGPIKDFLQRVYNKIQYGEYLTDKDFDKKYNESFEILIWKKTSASDVGHTAIRINGVVYGYYPTDMDGNGVYDVNDLKNSDGVMRVQNKKSFVASYMNQEITSYEIKATKQQKNLMLNELTHFTNDPGKYKLWGNQCTSVVLKVMAKSNIKIQYSEGQLISNPLIISHAMSPNTLKSALNNSRNDFIIKSKTSFIVK